MMAEGIKVLCTVVEYSSHLAMPKAVIRRRRGGGEENEGGPGTSTSIFGWAE
jgi:hypothetical protein